MNNLLDDISKNISVIKDPFHSDNITEIFIHYFGKSSYKSYWWAIVKFKNGNTTGEQRTPDCPDFATVIAELKTISESIK